MVLWRSLILAIQNSIMDMYIKSGKVSHAESVFEDPKSEFLLLEQYDLWIFQIGCLNVTLSWNTIISIFSEHGFGVQSLSTFVEMWSQGVRLNSTTKGRTQVEG